MDFLIYIRFKFRKMASDILRPIRKSFTDLISILLLVISLCFSTSSDCFGNGPSCQNNHFYENATEISAANPFNGELAVQVSLPTSTLSQSLQEIFENPPFHSIILFQVFISGSLQAELSRHALKRLRYTDILNQLHHYFFFF